MIKEYDKKIRLIYTSYRISYNPKRYNEIYHNSPNNIKDLIKKDSYY